MSNNTKEYLNSFTDSLLQHTVGRVPKLDLFRTTSDDSETDSRASSFISTQPSFSSESLEENSHVSHFPYPYDEVEPEPHFRGSNLPSADEALPIERSSSYADHLGNDVYRGIPSTAFPSTAPNTSSLYHATDAAHEFFNTEDYAYLDNDMTKTLTKSGPVDQELFLREYPGKRTRQNIQFHFFEQTLKSCHNAVGLPDAKKLVSALESVFRVCEIDVLKFSPHKLAWKCIAYISHDPVVFKVFLWRKSSEIIVEFSLREGSSVAFHQMLSNVDKSLARSAASPSSKQMSFKTLCRDTYGESDEDINNKIQHYLNLVESDYYDVQRQAAVRIANTISESPTQSLRKLIKGESKLSQLVGLLKNGHKDVTRCIATVVATLCERGDEGIKKSLVSQNVISNLVSSATTGSAETRRQCCRALAALVKEHKDEVEAYVSLKCKEMTNLIEVLQSEEVKDDSRLQEYAKALAPLIVK